MEVEETCFWKEVFPVFQQCRLRLVSIQNDQDGKGECKLVTKVYSCHVIDLYCRWCQKPVTMYKLR